MRHFPGMSTITAILEPDADGSLHLPLPAEFKHGRVMVVASLTAVADSGDEAPAHAGRVREWARRARGSVRLAAGESADDVRLAYYAGKYGVKR